MQKQHIAAGHDMDMVWLQLGPHHIQMYYQTAFKIAAGVLQAAKFAAGHEGVHPTRVLSMVDARQQDPLEPQSREYRRSEHRPNFKEWNVSFNLNIVSIRFDDTAAGIHFSNAVELYVWLRLAAKNAKRWAGDRGRQWTTTARLVDAEVNDKIVYVN